MVKNVLVVAGDTLPLPGFSTSGAGLRAWGLGEGLRSHGFHVDYSVPAVALDNGVTVPPLEHELYPWHPQTLERVIREARPDAVVFCHWPTVQIGKRLDIPTVIDFHGPHILERLFQNFGDVSSNGLSKIEALRKADFFTCAGEKQKLYFLSWLLLSGLDLTTPRIASVPVCLSPDLPDRLPPPAEPEFVYGGVYLPWQDPSVGLEAVADELAAQGKGMLRLFGGKHPNMPIKIPPVFARLEDKFQAMTNVSLEGFTARDTLVTHYLRGAVAVDLMAHNYERELAFTTRTVEYMWCGLAVIYNHYAELSPLIREYEAGWVLEPDDRPGIRQVVAEILANPDEAYRRGQNARQLVREHLTWDHAIAPLADFLHTPTRTHSLDTDLPSFIAAEMGVHNFWEQWSSAGQKVHPRILLRKATNSLRHGGLTQLINETRNFIRWQIDRRRQ